jgi:hypothetical protein
MELELNEHGLRVWKHKTNKEMFLVKSYRWKDSMSLLKENLDGQQHIMSFNNISDFDFTAWEPMTIKEYSLVKTKYSDIYNKPSIEDRIEVNGVWYVREDTLNDVEDQLDITFSDCAELNGDGCYWEATRIYKNMDKTECYPEIHIKYTDSRTKDVEYWENNNWFNELLHKNINVYNKAYEYAKEVMSENNIKLFIRFLRFLKENEWF